jgi:organic radical activating enzyme
VRSFTAAGTFPAKLLRQRVTDQWGRIRPIHLQLNPTNECNLSCSFCSCADRKKTARLSWPELREILTTFAGLGTQAVTITGGGEPLLHPKINAMLEYAEELGLDVGLVTNGTVVERLQHPGLLNWVRVSVADQRKLDDAFFAEIGAAAERTMADWSFSYVMSPKPNYAQIRRVVEFAGRSGFTHVRLVDDLLDLEKAVPMETVRAKLGNVQGSDLVIFQGRKAHTRGARRCLISLLKPVVSAESGVFPCCGAQYAIDGAAHDYNNAMSMGHWSAFPRKVLLGEHFDGSACDRCYYGQYNDALAMITEPLLHEAFV